jgi:hypothetical protein
MRKNNRLMAKAAAGTREQREKIVFFVRGSTSFSTAVRAVLSDCSREPRSSSAWREAMDERYRKHKSNEPRS